MDKEQIRVTLKGLQPQITQEFRASVEGFFGSRARENAADESDLDVLVRFADGANVYDLVGLGDFLERIFHCKVDVVSIHGMSNEFAAHIDEELIRV